MHHFLQCPKLLADALLDVATIQICSVNDTIYRFTLLNNAIHRYIPIYDMSLCWLQDRNVFFKPSYVGAMMKLHFLSRSSALSWVE